MCAIFRNMPKYCEPLDEVFHAMAHPSRRRVVELLSHQSLSLTQLGEHFQMAPPSLLDHVRILEKARVVMSSKVGRVRTYELVASPLIEAEHWLEHRRREWDERVDRLEGVVRDLMAENNHEQN
jgi:DNA-binding transcriptional ArsR family regulator